MRRPMVFVFAALLLGPAALAGGPAAMVKAGAVHVQRVNASADGSFCSYVEDQQLWRCRSFVISEYREPTGQYSQTRVILNQYRSWPNGYGYRTVECPVDRKALRVMPAKALVETTFDADSPDCIGYGEMVTFDPYEVTPWLYSGPQYLAADLLSPAYQDRRVTSYSFKDNQAGTAYRENCHGGAGWDPQAGGFTFNTFYREFGPDAAIGSFYYDTCGLTEK